MVGNHYDNLLWKVSITVFIITGLVCTLVVPLVGCTVDAIGCNDIFLSLSSLSTGFISSKLFYVSVTLFIGATSTIQLASAARVSHPDLQFVLVVLSIVGVAGIVVFLCFPLKTDATGMHENITHYLATTVGFGAYHTWCGLYAHTLLSMSTCVNDSRIVSAVSVMSFVNTIFGVAVFATIDSEYFFLASESLFLFGLFVIHAMFASILQPKFSAEHRKKRFYSR